MIASGSIGAAAVRSTRTKAAASTRARISTTIVTGAPKPCCWPLLSPKISAAIAAVTRIPPRTSMRWPPTGPLTGRRPLSASMIAISGGFTRNTARHDKYWVSKPPATIPAVAPAAVVACQIARARFRAGPSGFEVVSSDSAAGETNAPAAPWTMRAAMSISGHWARPHASDATANSTRPAASSRRRPSRSASRPPASNSEPNVSAYPVTIHCSSAAGMCRSSWIFGNATLTMLKSS